MGLQATDDREDALTVAQGHTTALPQEDLGESKVLSSFSNWQGVPAVFFDQWRAHRCETRGRQSKGAHDDEHELVRLTGEERLAFTIATSRRCWRSTGRNLLPGVRWGSCALHESL